MDARIIALYDNEANAPMINHEINIVVKEIQNNIIISELSRHLTAIMKSWIRTRSWYSNDGMSKFEHCLRNVVIKEMRNRVLDLLVKQDMPVCQVNVFHLYDEVQRVSRQLTSKYLWDMDAELTAEADRYRRSNGECLMLMDIDSYHPFSWFSTKTMSTHYHLPHVPKHLKNAIPLEVLAIDFKHDPNWECPICLEVDSIAVNSRCVRTECKHIFHMGCLDDIKRAFLQQKENYNKTCVPCPLCRALIH